MKVEFIGVGEAFDETLPNNSQILEWPDCRLLIDCGYSVPHALWKKHPEPDYLDAIYLSHRHADHYFGVPSVLVRFAEDKRTKSLTILCPEGMKSTILEMIDYAYLGVFPKLDFPIEFQEVTAGQTLIFQGTTLDFAISSHPVKNFAIRVSLNNRRYAYSGDGNFNVHTRQLYSNCSLLVHEAYAFGFEPTGHAEIAKLLEMAKDQKVERLALTHIEREVRKTRMREILDLIEESHLDVIIPEPGDVLEV
jgi:ribonuclease BN (tRNA processing enzyme)